MCFSLLLETTKPFWLFFVFSTMDQFWKNIVFHVLEAENGYELIFIGSFLCICKHKTLLDVVETYQMNIEISESDFWLFVVSFLSPPPHSASPKLETMKKAYKIGPIKWIISTGFCSSCGSIQPVKIHNLFTLQRCNCDGYHSIPIHADSRHFLFFFLTSFECAGASLFLFLLMEFYSLAV